LDALKEAFLYIKSRANKKVANPIRNVTMVSGSISINAILLNRKEGPNNKAKVII
jgi:hypothetical protein